MRQTKPYLIVVITAHTYEAKAITALCLTVNHGTVVLNVFHRFRMCAACVYTLVYQNNKQYWCVDYKYTAAFER